MEVDPDGRPASLICYILISCWNSRNRAQVCKSCPGHSLYTDWPRHNWKPNHRSYFIIPSKLNIDGRCHGRWTWIDDEYKTYLGEGIWQLGKHISLSAVSHPPARTVPRPPDQSILVFISTISVRRSHPPVSLTPSTPVLDINNWNYNQNYISQATSLIAFSSLSASRWVFVVSIRVFSKAHN